MDIYANGKLAAYGEVVVISGDKFGIKIVKLEGVRDAGINSKRN